jgi:hypothetical protein
LNDSTAQIKFSNENRPIQRIPIIWTGLLLKSSHPSSGKRYDDLLLTMGTTRNIPSNQISRSAIHEKSAKTTKRSQDLWECPIFEFLLHLECSQMKCRSCFMRRTFRVTDSWEREWILKGQRTDQSRERMGRTEPRHWLEFFKILNSFRIPTYCTQPNSQVWKANFFAVNLMASLDSIWLWQVVDHTIWPLFPPDEGKATNFSQCKRDLISFTQMPFWCHMGFKFWGTFLGRTMWHKRAGLHQITGGWEKWIITMFRMSLVR